VFEELLSRIGANLSKHALSYMIIGGQAVLLYGEPRMTGDIDVTLGMDTDRLGDLLHAVQGLALKPLPDALESFVKETMVLPTLDENSGIRVDFIFSFTPYEKEAIKRARKVKILGQEVNFASPEDLLIHKIFAGRPRDLEDVRSVLQKNPDLDVRYIRNWLQRFVEPSEGKNFLKTFEDLFNECAQA
jgi:Nucleotidyltransferase of unknown function (DUF6036)